MAIPWQGAMKSLQQPGRALEQRRPEFPSTGFPIPSFCLEEGRYRVRFAADAADLERVLRLRYLVFNVELGEGLPESHLTGLDRDQFDAQCHHLLVETVGEGEVVGTYRMQTYEMAQAGFGFYSAGEYDFGGWPQSILERSAEMGRACVHREHRHRSVLLLLWKGIGQYALSHHKRYLFGCCSITSQDPQLGGRAHAFLRAGGHWREDLPLPARAEYRCIVDAENLGDVANVRLPRLFQTYLRYGAKICGEPALDRSFGTIDFLALVDLHALDATAIQRQLDFDPREAR